MTVSPGGLLKKWNLALLVLLKPLGLWGLGGLSVIDSALIPMPLDPLVVDYVAQDHGKLLLYCVVAAAGSALGGLVPYYLGRAGGEQILLKRINRRRYEQLRDRFESQEFLVLMVPALIPQPFPTPMKLFELAAGVFEIRPLIYLSAVFLGKLLRFLLLSILVIVYGPTILQTMTHAIRQHLPVLLWGVGALGLVLSIFITRKLFERRRGPHFPTEDEAGE